MGKCATCDYYKYQDDGNELTCRCCFKTKKGKAMTYAMYTYLPSMIGFVLDTEELERRRMKMKEYPVTHKEPYWCPLNKSYDVEILFEANGTAEDLQVLYDNLDSMKEFSNSYEREDFREENGFYHCVFRGKYTGDINKLIKLTHHGEPLYEESNFEHVHIEICIGGKWYGKAEN